MSATQIETTFTSVAKELANAFTSDKRDDGKTFYKFRDDAPEWIRRENEKSESLSLRFHRAVDDRLPDDWIYQHAALIADTLADNYKDAEDAREHSGEIADGLVDVYNADLAAWLASHLFNQSLCDEAVEEIGVGTAGGITGAMQAGQFMALERIANCLISEIEAEMEHRATL